MFSSILPKNDYFQLGVKWSLLVCCQCIQYIYIRQCSNMFMQLHIYVSVLPFLCPWYRAVSWSTFFDTQFRLKLDHFYNNWGPDDLYLSYFLLFFLSQIAISTTLKQYRTKQTALWALFITTDSTYMLDWAQRRTGRALANIRVLEKIEF